MKGKWLRLEPNHWEPDAAKAAATLGGRVSASFARVAAGQQGGDEDEAAHDHGEERELQRGGQAVNEGSMGHISIWDGEREAAMHWRTAEPEGWGKVFEWAGEWEKEIRQRAQARLQASRWLP